MYVDSLLYITPAAASSTSGQQWSLLSQLHSLYTHEQFSFDLILSTKGI